MSHEPRNEALRIGARAEIRKTFTAADVQLFATLSTDDNPLHLDPEFAKTTPFGACIVHGALLVSLFSGILGRDLPGHGSVYMGQSHRFLRPILVGEEVTAYVEVKHIRDDKPIVTLATVCLNSKGEVAVEGEAVVRVPR
jgi:enoyl-CoA hydratase